MSSLLTPEVLLLAYQRGYFPMADPETGEVAFYSPEVRAIIPLERTRVSRSLRQTIRKGIYEIRINTAFEAVIQGCAERPYSWISPELISVYTDLHYEGFAHSVEAWYQGRLVGGLYGVALGGAFFGESMFTRMRDASKVAFVALVERLRQRGFVLLDAQYSNPHTQRLGAVEIPRYEYLRRLWEALRLQRRFADD
ncbi:MAG: leucyl/phenylalanyl-tRNA--protein transferase [Candidatus Kapabacteria bacterium]|nr:leucyl/phenylalanyl-tRNA--protein transferase [Candidatus Kapabacteria bacterium]MCS7170022.1 leucyl/phenylalanyl-tRNA--protein transferase [Candidatus Kapabacteria bacterium]MDW7996700.1 leucyl/phenylalanyl-tRNA--protein transferase [Bacteroidota bacterium]MDW8224672.1 leucyl/phenylalanyl-tRNA--protein transferase [Bacteroidota bacterium]